MFNTFLIFLIIENVYLFSVFVLYYKRSFYFKKKNTYVHVLLTMAR